MASKNEATIRSKRYYRALREKLLKEGGSKCQMCLKLNLQSTGKLEFHHLKYAKDSVRDGHALARLLEVRDHPKRFALVCKKHHLFIHANSRIPIGEGMKRRLTVAKRWDYRRYRYLVNGQPDNKRYNGLEDEVDEVWDRLVASMGRPALGRYLNVPEQESPMEKIERRLRSPLQIAQDG